MKIIAAEVFVTSPSRNFVTLRITTEDGVTGIGDATLNGRELAVAAYLKEHIAQLLIGKDPHRIEDMTPAPRRHRQGPQAGLHRPSEQAAKERFAEFTAEWGQRYPAIVRLWESSWAEFVPFLEYDVEIRLVICTTNAIESINARYRRALGDEVEACAERVREYLRGSVRKNHSLMKTGRTHTPTVL
ncbi:UNVERIFIED_ORG: hypothetical protein J2X79_004304 [Arthrobacter globiformis]|nr:hypothetical protein [Arthrobacter globiformis]